MTTTPTATPAEQPQKEESALSTAKGWLESYIKELSKAMPSGLMRPDRFLRVALNALSNNPRLAECTKPSLMLAMMRSAQLGLEPDGLLGQAYVIPYRNKHLNGGRGGFEAVFQIGYQGFMILAERSGLLSGPPVARVVRKRDVFDYWFGLTEDHFKHIPYRGAEEPGDITDAYCIVRLKEGAPLLTVFSIDKVESYRERSQAKDDGPWITDYEAMVIKTMIRAGLKYAPKRVETVDQERLQRAISLDERAEAGVVIDLTPEEARMVGRSTARPDSLEALTAGNPITMDSVMSGKTTGENDAPAPVRTKKTEVSEKSVTPEVVTPEECPVHFETVARATKLQPGKSIDCPGCHKDVKGTAPVAQTPAAADTKSTKAKGKTEPAAEAPTEAPATAPTASPAPSGEAQDDLFR